MATFAERMDESLLSMKSAHRAAVKTAFTDAQTALLAEQVSYGTKVPEKQNLDDILVNLARDLSAQIK